MSDVEITSAYAEAARLVKTLPNPIRRTNALGVTSRDWRKSDRARFEQVAERIPGAWRTNRGLWFVPATLLAALDTGRAHSAWASLGDRVSDLDAPMRMNALLTRSGPHRDYDWAPHPRVVSLPRSGPPEREPPTLGKSVGGEVEQVSESTKRARRRHV